jgi:hypothetical protein
MTGFVHNAIIFIKEIDANIIANGIFAPNLAYLTLLEGPLGNS